MQILLWSNETKYQNHSWLSDDIEAKEANMKKRLIFATMFVAVFTTSIVDMVLKSRMSKTTNSGS